VQNALLTIVALCCFAANSLLTRMALRTDLIDAPTFMNVRLASGALVLAIISRKWEGSWRGAMYLALYAIAFSFAYLRLTASTGALILFSVVQLTMMIHGIAKGERPTAREWAGVAIAFAGLIALTLPGLAAPDPLGVLLMFAAGIGWGFYSLAGKGAKSPMAANAGHFLKALPFTLAVSALTFPHAHFEARGVVLGLASGMVASGLGYIIWYAALRGLSSAQAGIVQLAVPALAAAGGVIFIGETLSPRLVGSGTAILAGILIAKLK
jgi:drug/metabolite transporter (DMT)-like permease